MLRISAFKMKAIFEGGMSLLPGVKSFFSKGTRGSDSARYCYSVWLRHLVSIHPHLPALLNGVVVELGPGDSLGIGLAALLSGARRYVAVDVVRHAKIDHNLKVFGELVTLFARQAPIPDNNEFPEIKPYLEDYSFPAHILDLERMRQNLDDRRLSGITDSLRGATDGEMPVEYVEPSTASTVIAPSSVDMVFSQAVLEHVDNLAAVYRACYAWLKPNGVMSHQIDFRSHGCSREWNGHWVYPDPVWRLIRGGRPYLLNREPCGTHLRLLAEAGFEVVTEERGRLPSRLAPEQLASRFRTMSEDDLTTSGLFVVARKIST